ncbi:DUF6194 family protein [Saccharopolyspora sp. MS10]|uniref:DUF6194 family protein n=1 Tax=Saccharopolyspora sp. MS10 TaxID=3385973 RepID=UPI0039A00507
MRQPSTSTSGARPNHVHSVDPASGPNPRWSPGSRAPPGGANIPRSAARPGRSRATAQPCATIATKDYPGDTGSRRDTGDRRRPDVHVGPQVCAERLGRQPGRSTSRAWAAVRRTRSSRTRCAAFTGGRVVHPGSATITRPGLHGARLADRRSAGSPRGDTSRND